MEAGKGKYAASASAAAATTPTSSSVPAAKDLKGDGDPLDAVELSETALTTGTVVPVRILGAFALIDEARRKKIFFSRRVGEVERAHPINPGKSPWLSFFFFLLLSRSLPLSLSPSLPASLSNRGSSTGRSCASTPTKTSSLPPPLLLLAALKPRRQRRRRRRRRRRLQQLPLLRAPPWPTSRGPGRARSSGSCTGSRTTRSWRAARRGRSASGVGS